MTINHHPRDETLLRNALGTSSAGPALVVGVHLEYCDLCRARVADFESIGGQILEDMAPRQLVAGALALTLERLDVSSASPRRKAIIAPRRADLGIALPTSMPPCNVGPWRWLGSGFRWRRVAISGSPRGQCHVSEGQSRPEAANAWTHRHGVHAATVRLPFRRVWSLRSQRSRRSRCRRQSPARRRFSIGVHLLAALDGGTRLHGAAAAAAVWLLSHSAAAGQASPWESEKNAHQIMTVMLAFPALVKRIGQIGAFHLPRTVYS
jgi:putative transcriptional regulator